MRYWIAAFFKSLFSLLFATTFVVCLTVGWFLFLSRNESVVVGRFRKATGVIRAVVLCFLLVSAAASLYFAAMATAWMHFFTVEKAPA